MRLTTVRLFDTNNEVLVDLDKFAALVEVNLHLYELYIDGCLGKICINRTEAIRLRMTLEGP